MGRPGSSAGSHATVIAPAHRLASIANVDRQTSASPSSGIHQASASRRACCTSGSSKRSAASASGSAQTCAKAPCTGVPSRQRASRRRRRPGACGSALRRLPSKTILANGFTRAAAPTRRGRPARSHGDPGAAPPAWPCRGTSTRCRWVDRQVGIEGEARRPVGMVQRVGGLLAGPSRGSQRRSASDRKTKRAPSPARKAA